MKWILALSLFLLGSLPALSAKDLRKSIAKIRVITQDTDYYYYPWRWSTPKVRNGQGIVVGEDLVLTLASTVLRSRAINLRLDTEPGFTQMEIVHMDLDANLALLKGELPESAEILDLPKKSKFKKGKKVNYFWKTEEGRFMEGSAELDRVDSRKSVGTHQYHLWYEAVNVSKVGGFGEPVMMDGEFFGLFSNNGSGAEMSILPVDVINRTFSFPEGEILAPTGALGFQFTPCTQRNLRSLKGLDGMDGGCLIAEVYEQGSGSKTLKAGDVILEIDGQAIDAWGRVEHPIYGLLDFPYILSENSLNSKLKVVVMRDGEKLDFNIDLGLINDYNWVVPRYRNGESAEYFIRGGFIFQSLSLPYLQTWGKDWRTKAPDDILMLLKKTSYQTKSSQRRDIVMLSRVLPHQVNRGFQYLGGRIIQEVNGKPIKSMKHLVEILNDLKQEKITLSFYPDGVPLVLDPKTLKVIDSEIRQIYGIPKLSTVP